VVWGNAPLADSLAAVVPGRIHALNAENLQELWSADIGVNDPSERFAKNNPPTVANGKVYVAAFGPANNAPGSVNSSYSGKVIVYGLTRK
jgi:outer membrane protein assembly factor BamB